MRKIMRKITEVFYMGEYKPPFTITNKILSYISSISEEIGRITATSNLESKPHLRRNPGSKKCLVCL